MALIESWIDNLTKVWEIDDGKGSTVRSYRLYERDEYPEAINDFPCVLTYVTGVRFGYSAGGPNFGYWTGVSEFHLTDDLDKSKIPYILLFFERIYKAAAANMQLSGTVAHFLLSQQDEGGQNVQGPVVMAYGDEAPHHGLIANWEVKQDVSGLITPSA